MLKLTLCFAIWLEKSIISSFLHLRARMTFERKQKELMIDH